jgi:maleate isomerase
MKTIDYELIAEDHRIRLGMIVLQSDVTIEDEFRAYFKDSDISLLVSRIPFENEVTAETLGAMSQHLKQSTALFPLTQSFDAVGYACTSGAMQIGSEVISQLVKNERTCDYVSNPMQAALAAFGHLGAKNIGYLAPYSTDVCQTMIDHIQASGFNVAHALSFDEAHDQAVGQISPNAIYRAALALVNSASQDLDAIFIACTNMKCATVLDQISADTGIPALSSNKALAWDLARSSGIPFSL